MTEASNRIPKSRQREAPGDAYRWIGRSMKRVEDPRLLTGQGSFTAASSRAHFTSRSGAAITRMPSSQASGGRWIRTIGSWCEGAGFFCGGRIAGD